MSSRIVHLITAECDIQVQRLGPDTVRVRISERDDEIPDRTDFEIEGSATHISEALATIASVLVNLDELLAKDSN